MSKTYQHQRHRLLPPQLYQTHTTPRLANRIDIKARETYLVWEPNDEHNYEEEQNILSPEVPKGVGCLFLLELSPEDKRCIRALP
jgi:hypothetical protein